MLTSTLIALVGCVLVTSSFAQALQYDVAAGSTVTASSTYLENQCSGYKCSPVNVVNNNSSDGIYSDFWFSAPGSCDPNRNESLYIDWSRKYGTQLLSEVRFRYGPNAANGVSLILYSETPMNIPNPTAVTYVDDQKWYVFVMNQNVTASSIRLVWTGLASQDGSSSGCLVSVAEVQAWVGPSPDPLPGPSEPGARSGLSAGAIAAIILVPLLILGAGAFWFVRTRRINLLKTRLAREIELSRQNSGAQTLADGEYSTSLTANAAPIAKNANTPMNPRTRNYLEAQARDSSSNAV